MNIKRRKQNNFTLAEVTIAMAVVAVGMVGILALFPVGLQATRDAMGDNYSSEIADQFIHLVKMQCEQYADSGTTKDGWGEWITDDPATPSNNALIPQLPTAVPSASILDADKVTKGTGVFGDGDSDGFDDVGVYYDGDSTDTDGVFYAEARSASGEIMDWDGVIYIWREALRWDSNGDGVDDSDIPYPVAVRLCLEVSWPKVKPYAQRRKRVYAIEIFNPNDRAGY